MFVSGKSIINQPVLNFKGLNALRFFAAISIVLFHSTQSSFNDLPYIKSFVHNLALGVDLFFVISGFLIVYLLLLEKEKYGKISISKFYLRRSLRILPLYLFIIGLAFYFDNQASSKVNFFNYLYFCGNFDMIRMNEWPSPMLTPLWSICIEEQFYLFIPILVSILPVKKIPYLFISIILASFVFRYYIRVTDESYWMILYCHTVSRFDLLAIGGLLAYLYQTKKLLIKVNSFFVLIALTFLFLVMCLVDGYDYTRIISAIGKKYLFAIPILFVFVYFILQEQENSIVIWLKTNHIINYLGKISFGIYMYHTPAALAIENYAWINHTPLLHFFSTAFVTIVFSILSYEFFEKPILSLKSRFVIIPTTN